MGNRACQDAITPTAESGVRQYLTFVLGGEMFAIEILNIREIIEYGVLTHVPMLPAFIRGVINLRGAGVPVIDLSVRFGRAPVAETPRTCIVIIDVDNANTRQDIGIVVDSVSEVLEIPDSCIEPVPAFGEHIRTDFIQGMGKINDRFVIVLSVLHILSVEEMAALGGSTQAGAAEVTAP